MDISLFEIAAIAGGLLLGGFVKGVTGSGLPLTSAPIIALTTNVPTAVTLITLPSILTNAWQAWPVRHGKYALKPFLPLFAVLLPATIVGVLVLKNADTRTLLFALGVIVLSGAVFLLARPKFKLPRRLRRAVGFLCAAVGGVVGGMAGQAGVVLVPYFVSLRLRPDRHIVVISIAYLIVLLPLTALILVLKVVPSQLFLFSAAAVVPSLIGLRIGQYYRSRIDPGRFRLFVLVILIAGASAMIWKSLAS